MFRPFANWLSTTGPSVWMQTHEWVVPTSQSIHIACVGLLLTSALTINARLLGWRKPGRSIPGLFDTLLPVMKWSLGGLLLTGTVQAVAEPVRQFVTPAFWAKMLSIVVVVILTSLFARKARAEAMRGDDGREHFAGARAFAIGTSLLWVAIVTLGRLIGYTWLDYT